MKKITCMVVFLLLSLAAYPCDACGNAATGGYIGILPQFNRHFVGIRYQFRYFSSLSATDPASGVRNVEYYHTWNIWGRINPHKRLQILINAPMHYYQQVDKNIKRELIGPGDIWTLVQYQVIRTPDSSAKKMRQSFMLGGGIKLPTGRFNIYDSTGYYDRNLQPGTGSWDFLLSAQYTLRWKGWGLNAELNARLSTLNPDNYLYGHKLNANLKGFYWAKGEKVSVLTSAGFGYDYGSKDVYLHQKITNSGGHMVSASASADLYIKRWVVGAEFRMPFYAEMSSGLLNPGPQLMSQLMFTF
jgi:hypothetical protein